jgi:hypothetical protein
VFRILGFLLFFVWSRGAMAFLAVPLVVNPMLTQTVRDMGVQAETCGVSVGHARPGAADSAAPATCACMAPTSRSAGAVVARST